MRLRIASGEEGYTIIAVVGAIALVTLLAGAALAATNGDLGLVRRDLDEKRAFAAAQAGIGDYSFHLNNDNSYWARCTNVPPPHAVNQMGSTANRRPVPGETDAEYAIELLPATGQTSCNPTNPVTSMLEPGGTNTGTFRIRSTGWAGDTTRSIVATYKRASFLDYIYFTQLETSDPVTYDSNTITSATAQCDQFIREGRQSAPLANHGGQPCDVISFISEDEIEGPLHTNDALTVCGSPTFGRSPADLIEVSEEPTPTNHNEGWYTPSQLLFSGGCSSGDPDFSGELETTAPVLTPPATNGKLKTIAAADGTLYSCQTRIQLNGTSMTVFPNSSPTSGTTVSIPPSGVVYVQNANCPDPSPACSTAYSPFTATYPTRSDCGTVRVHGTYSGQLTIAAENDIIVWDDLNRTSNGLLGLVANNFVRVRHPFNDTDDTVRGSCGSGTNQPGTQPDLNIDAAILAIQHSFIVDHYDCGAPLEQLTVEGAISQKFRGAVGTFGGGGVVSGYEKDYVYDDRLRYLEPPEYLDPVQSAWHIQRETLDFP
jgi:hypothetical protein